MEQLQRKLTNVAMACRDHINLMQFSRGSAAKLLCRMSFYSWRDVHVLKLKKLTGQYRRWFRCGRRDCSRERCILAHCPAGAEGRVCASPISGVCLDPSRLFILPRQGSQIISTARSTCQNVDRSETSLTNTVHGVFSVWLWKQRSCAVDFKIHCNSLEADCKIAIHQKPMFGCNAASHRLLVNCMQSCRRSGRPGLPRVAGVSGI